MFEPDAEAQQTGREVLLAVNGGASFDRRFHRPEAGRVTHNSNTRADTIGRVCSARHVEGDDAAEQAKLCCSDLVRWMRDETGISDGLDHRMLRQTGRELPCRASGVLCSQRIRAHSANRKERLQRSWRCAAQLTLRAQPLKQTVVPGRRYAAQKVRVTAEVLGR